MHRVFLLSPTTRGLVPPETRVTLDWLREFATGDIRADAPGFVEPLERSAHGVREQLPPDAEVVLLGSIATNKYLDVLLRVFDYGCVSRRSSSVAAT